MEAVFHAPAPMPAAEQMETFQTLLEDTLSDECRYQVVQSVHGQLREMIEEHKANKVEEPLVELTRAPVRPGAGALRRVGGACGGL